MIFKPLSVRAKLCIGAATFLVLLVGYTAFAAYRQSEERRLNGPDAVDKTFPTWTMFGAGLVRVWDPLQGGVYPEKVRARMIEKGTAKRWIVVDASATTWRFAVGMFFGVSAAFVLGVLMGCFHTMDAICNPIVTLLSKVPPPALMAIFYMVAGLGTPLYASVIAFGIIPTLAVTVSLIIKEYPQQLIVKAKTLGASTTEIIWNVIIPSVMPKLFEQTRLHISGVIVTLLFIEMAVGDRGIGYRINTQRRLYEMNVVFLYVAFTAIAMFALDYLFRFAQAKLYPWYAKNGE